MKISVITVVYNADKTIRDCIDSVLSQTHGDIEYIIVDGASTDKTFEIVQSFGEKIQKKISEPDKGIYDAMNKGIKMATGDVVAILNADDLYASEDILETVSQTFRNDPYVDIVYGDLYYVDKDDVKKVRRVWKTGKFKLGNFKKGWHTPHPAFFVKKKIYEKYGLYNTELPLSADYEFMFRLLELEKVSAKYIPKVCTLMRMGGASNASLKNIIRANKEVLKAWEINNVKAPNFLILRKLFLKVKQYILSLI